MASIPVKANLGGDLRRLTLSAPATFPALLRALRNEYELDGTPVRIWFRDDEGDYCALTSNASLREALALVPGVLRVRVHPAVVQRGAAFAPSVEQHIHAPSVMHSARVPALHRLERPHRVEHVPSERSDSSEHVLSEHMSSERASSERVLSGRVPSGLGRSSRVPSERVVSERVPSERVPSERVPSERVPSERVPSERVPSEKVLLSEHGRTSHVPSERVPSERVPSERFPSERFPSERMPSERFPSERVPSERVPSERIPSERVPSDHEGSAEYVPSVECEPSGVCTPIEERPQSGEHGGRAGWLKDAVARRMGRKIKLHVDDPGLFVRGLEAIVHRRCLAKILVAREAVKAAGALPALWASRKAIVAEARKFIVRAVPSAEGETVPGSLVEEFCGHLGTIIEQAGDGPREAILDAVRAVCADPRGCALLRRKQAALIERRMFRKGIQDPGKHHHRHHRHHNHSGQRRASSGDDDAKRHKGLHNSRYYAEKRHRQKLGPREAFEALVAEGGDAVQEAYEAVTLSMEKRDEDLVCTGSLCKELHRSSRHFVTEHVSSAYESIDEGATKALTDCIFKKMTKAGISAKTADACAHLAELMAADVQVVEAALCLKDRERLQRQHTKSRSRSRSRSRPPAKADEGSNPSQNVSSSTDLDLHSSEAAYFTSSKAHHKS